MDPRVEEPGTRVREGGGGGTPTAPRRHGGGDAYQTEENVLGERRGGTRHSSGRG